MASSKPLVLTGEQAQQIAKALADPRRYEILKRLGEYEKALDCGSVRDCVDITQATLSHHMKELELAQLVRSVRKGKYVSYILRRDVLDAFFERLKSDLA